VQRVSSSHLNVAELQTSPRRASHAAVWQLPPTRLVPSWHVPAQLVVGTQLATPAGQDRDTLQGCAMSQLVPSAPQAVQTALPFAPCAQTPALPQLMRLLHSPPVGTAARHVPQPSAPPRSQTLPALH
jgi:hypothetical protein